MFGISQLVFSAIIVAFFTNLGAEGFLFFRPPVPLKRYLELFRLILNVFLILILNAIFKHDMSKNIKKS